MKFRYIDIPKLVFQVLRSNYAVRYDYDENEQPQATSNIYRLCLAMCVILTDQLQSYYRTREKAYILSVCTPVYNQTAAVLNYLFGYNDEIYITPSGAQADGSYLYMEDEPATYLYTEDEPQVFWGQIGTYTESPIINIPLELQQNTVKYNQFIADLNTLFPFYLPYTIRTY